MFKQFHINTSSILYKLKIIGGITTVADKVKSSAQLLGR